jgi:hypothetical protein
MVIVPVMRLDVEIDACRRRHLISKRMQKLLALVRMVGG